VDLAYPFFEQKERDLGGLGVPVVAVGDSGYVCLFNVVRGEFVKRLCEVPETPHIARRRPNPVKSAIRRGASGKFQITYFAETSYRREIRNEPDTAGREERDELREHSV